MPVEVGILGEKVRAFTVMLSALKRRNFNAAVTLKNSAVRIAVRAATGHFASESLQPTE